MERRIEIVLEIGSYSRRREADIKKACMVEWNFREDDFVRSRGSYGQNKLLRAEALGTISEGEDKNEIVKRIEQAVWRANGAMCHVAVGTRELDPYPFGAGNMSDEEYERQIA